MPPIAEKVFVLTLGCPKNAVDSEVVLKQLQANGAKLALGIAEAETALINTCGFIESAKEESIQAILEAVELKKRGKLKNVVVMGCLSERYQRELRLEIPGVDAFVGANDPEAAVEALGGRYRRELLGERLLTTPSHFAYLKISEGCDRPCSFCAIPLMRGRHISKPPSRVVLEAKRLAALGVKELILIAQDSTFYGLDLTGKRELPGLLAQLGAVEGIEWIRLMYAFPAGFPGALLEEFGRNPKLCRYIDMPVQHVSDRVLTSMRRGVSSRGLRKLIGSIRSAVPGIALRTTLIVGYPGEGEREFRELLDFVNETEFDRLGVFTYSPEEGTSAEPLGDPVPAEVKEERRAAIMQAQQEISLRKNRALIGTTIRVLIDAREGDAAVGRTERDAPEVDNEVTIHSAPGLAAGTFCDVELVDADAYDLFAEAPGPASGARTAAAG